MNSGLLTVAIMNNALNARNSRRIRQLFSNDRILLAENKIEIWIMQIQTGSVLCKYSQDVCYANSHYANVLGGTFISTFLQEAKAFYYAGLHITAT